MEDPASRAALTTAVNQAYDNGELRPTVDVLRALAASTENPGAVALMELLLTLRGELVWNMASPASQTISLTPPHVARQVVDQVRGP